MADQADQRLIEDYIPIEAISAEARREKSIRKGHISTLHLWWARRPLVAARAAVYGALVPAPADKKAAKEAEKVVLQLCTYPAPRDVVKTAQQHILQAHADRLTVEMGQPVTVEDIEAGRAPRPRVLDMFAGGGAIPLEALRLGCEAYALDLNPVAHLIQLCTLVYPQQFGPPDPAAAGCGLPSPAAVDNTLPSPAAAGSALPSPAAVGSALPSPAAVGSALPSPGGGGGVGGGGWAGLAAEVEYWGKWVLERVRAEIGDLYPPIPDPQSKIQNPKSKIDPAQLSFDLAVTETRQSYQTPPGYLTPVAYLWTRTVRCKNPACGGTVPLARQTWLAKKPGRYVALKPDIPPLPEGEGPGVRAVHYRVVEATTEKGLGFDPAAGSKGGNVACPFCGTVVDSAYVKAEGQAGRMGVQQMAVVCTRSNQQGRVYLSTDQLPQAIWPNEEAIWQRIRALEKETSASPAGPLTVPEEPIISDSKGSAWIIQYGLTRFGDLFMSRQLLALMTFAKYIRVAYTELLQRGYEIEHVKAISAFLGLSLDKLADLHCSLAQWKNGAEAVVHALARQAIPMVWDFAESNPISEFGASWYSAVNRTAIALKEIEWPIVYAKSIRGSATQILFEDNTLDAIITDPPYYDNVAYADLSDFFYVWLKRSIGFLYPEHFSSLLTPKKNEAVADATRHGGDRKQAAKVYEEMMGQAFTTANRILKPGAPLVIVYAHKTTLGWSTLVDALRVAGFTVTEAWPLDTEMGARMTAMDTAALASSIFLVARRRESSATGSYEEEVRPELQSIVRERLERLWAQGITGADLVIACVGAGLRAFTRFAQVEYANGEPVPAGSFLTEVEGAVLEALLEKLFGVNAAGVSSVDPVTRFYVLWRFAYRHATIDAGEAIVFAYPQHVELDGPNSLSSGRNALVEKQKGKYRLRDFAERGEDRELGLPTPSGRGVGGEGWPSLIDVLHRLLWLVENRPNLIPAYLDEARPDLERLRVIAQTLAGQVLAGGNGGGSASLVAAKGAEAAALRKLTTNWRSLIESHRGTLV